VDEDDAGCKESRKSHSGVILFINRAPIMRYSKRQNTVETSIFESDIGAMRIAIELVEGMIHKMRMMEVPIDREHRVFCGNEYALKNVSRLESPLTKKHNSLAYHNAREGIAAKIIRLEKKDGLTNIADLFTKLFPESEIQRNTWNVHVEIVLRLQDVINTRVEMPIPRRKNSRETGLY